MSVYSFNGGEPSACGWSCDRRSVEFLSFMSSFLDVFFLRSSSVFDVFSLCSSSVFSTILSLSLPGGFLRDFYDIVVCECGGKRKKERSWEISVIIISVLQMWMEVGVSGQSGGSVPALAEEASSIVIAAATLPHRLEGVSHVKGTTPKTPDAEIKFVKVGSPLLLSSFATNFAWHSFFSSLRILKVTSATKHVAGECCTPTSSLFRTPRYTIVLTDVASADVK